MKSPSRLAAVTCALLLGTVAYARAQNDSVFAVSTGGVNLLRLNNDAAFVVRGTAGSGILPATGAGVRMMWFPNLYAFRAGQVSSFGAAYWDLSSIGAGSTANFPGFPCLYLCEAEPSAAAIPCTTSLNTFPRCS